MGNDMFGNKIKRDLTTVLLTKNVKFAWALIRIGQHWDSIRAPTIARLYERLLLIGLALEVWVEKTAQRLEIDVFDVLAPVVAARIS